MVHAGSQRPVLPWTSVPLGTFTRWAPVHGELDGHRQWRATCAARSAGSDSGGSIGPYEVAGAWGRSAEWAFEQVLEAKEATLSPEFVDFDLVQFGEHWRQCIAAAMAKGAAAVLSRSASPGELASGRVSTVITRLSNSDQFSFLQIPATQ